MIFLFFTFLVLAGATHSQELMGRNSSKPCVDSEKSWRWAGEFGGVKGAAQQKVERPQSFKSVTHSL